MLQQQWSNKEINEWLLAIQEGNEAFQEAKGFEILEPFDQEEVEINPVQQSTLLSLLAQARFQRIGQTID